MILRLWLLVVINAVIFCIAVRCLVANAKYKKPQTIIDKIICCPDLPDINMPNSFEVYPVKFRKDYGGHVVGPKRLVKVSLIQGPPSKIICRYQSELISRPDTQFSAIATSAKLVTLTGDKCDSLVCAIEVRAPE